MAKKFFPRALSVGLSLALCASMVLPSFAASFADLQNAIDGKSDTAETQFTAEDGSTRYGYGDKNEETGKYGIEAWTEGDTRKVELNEDVEFKFGEDTTQDIYGTSGHNLNTKAQSGIVIDGTKEGQENVVIELNGHDIDLNPNYVMELETREDGVVNFQYYEAQKDGEGNFVKDENGDKVADTSKKMGGNYDDYLTRATVITVTGGANVTINDSSATEVTKTLPGTITKDEDGNPVSASGEGTHEVTYYEGGKGAITGGCNADPDGKNDGDGYKWEGQWIAGGGITIHGSSLTMNGASAVKNLGFGHGGGIYVYRDSDLEMNGGRVSENMVADGVSQGGGIGSFEGADNHVLLTGVELSENLSYMFGGAFSANGGHSYFDHCTVQGNVAGSIVGGILGGDEDYILNSTITGNTAWVYWNDQKYPSTSVSSENIYHSNVCNNFHFDYDSQVTTPEAGSTHQDAESWKEYHEDEKQRVEPNGTEEAGKMVYVCDYCGGLHHEVPLYMIRVDRNTNSDNDITDDVIEGGKTPSDPGTPTRENYTFGGWFVVTTDEEGNEVETPFDPSKPVEEGMLIRAKWTPNTDGGNGGNNGNDDITLTDEEIPLAGIFTRGDAIGYLWRQAGEPEWELSDFEDVPEDHEWAVAIGWAQDMGIARADEEGNFRPDDLVLRSVESLEISPEGELQEFLNWYAAYAGVELDEGELFIQLAGAWDDVIMGEEAQVIFDEFFAKLEAALSQAA